MRVRMPSNGTDDPHTPTKPVTINLPSDVPLLKAMLDEPRRFLSKMGFPELEPRHVILLEPHLTKSVLQKLAEVTNRQAYEQAAKSARRRIRRKKTAKPIKAIHLGDRCYKIGKKTVKVTPTDDAVLHALAKTIAMDEGELISASKVDHAAKVLRRLVQKDPAWKKIISLPGRKSGDGYRGRIVLRLTVPQ